MKTTLKEFNTSLSQLKQDLNNDLELEQNHFGDFLMIKEPKEYDVEQDNYKVWLSHIENVKQGQSKWQIEFCGKSNGYLWRIISEGNN